MPTPLLMHKQRTKRTSSWPTPPSAQEADIAAAALNPYFGPEGHYTSLLDLHLLRYTANYNDNDGQAAYYPPYDYYAPGELSAPPGIVHPRAGRRAAQTQTIQAQPGRRQRYHEYDRDDFEEQFAPGTAYTTTRNQAQPALTFASPAQQPPAPTRSSKRKGKARADAVWFAEPPITTTSQPLPYNNMETSLAHAERARQTVQAGESTTQSPSDRTAQIRKTAVEFCRALTEASSQEDYTNLLETYFTSNDPKITEHGPLWARDRLPYIAQTFTGLASASSSNSEPNSKQDSKTTCNDYFTLLSSTLKCNFKASSFPPENEFIVDAEAVVSADEEVKGEGKESGKGVVCVVSGLTEFQAVETGKKWTESFVYRFSGFDSEGKIGHWEIWADALSAWVGVGGEEAEK